MSFESGAVSLRMFTLARPLADDVIDAFAENSLPSLDSVREDAVFGWVTGRHLLDRNINDESAYLGGSLRLSLVKAERKIPTSLLKAEQKQEEIVRLQMKSLDFVSRKEKSEIREELIERLLPQMPPQLKELSMVKDPESGFLYTDAVSEKQADEFVIHFRHATGIGAEPVTPQSLALSRKRIDVRDWYPSSFSPKVEDEAVSDDAGMDFLTWLWFLSEAQNDFVETSQGKISLLIEGPLQFLMEGGGAHESVIRKGNPTVSAEAKASLLAGKKLTKARVSFVRGEDVWSGNFDAVEFVMRSMKLPEDPDKLEPISRFQDRLIKIGEFREMLFTLYDQFVEIRADKERWRAERSRIHDWVTDRKSIN